MRERDRTEQVQDISCSMSRKQEPILAIRCASRQFFNMRDRPTDGQTDGRTDLLIEMQGRI